MRTHAVMMSLYAGPMDMFRVVPLIIADAIATDYRNCSGHKLISDTWDGLPMRGPEVYGLPELCTPTMHLKQTDVVVIEDLPRIVNSIAVAAKRDFRNGNPGAQNLLHPDQKDQEVLSQPALTRVREGRGNEISDVRALYQALSAAQALSEAVAKETGLEEYRRAKLYHAPANDFLSNDEVIIPQRTLSELKGQQFKISELPPFARGILNQPETPEHDRLRGQVNRQLRARGAGGQDPRMALQWRL